MVDGAVSDPRVIEYSDGGCDMTDDRTDQPFPGGVPFY